MLGLTQGFPTGELWGLNAHAFSFRGRQNLGGSDIWVIPTISFEKLYVRVLQNYVKIALSDLGLLPPYSGNGSHRIKRRLFGCTGRPT
jgi:hypothetical protein